MERPQLKQKTTTGEKKPSSNGENGRNAATGRFVQGWRGGPGNPLAAKVQLYRIALFDAVTSKDIAKVIRKLMALAHAGDVAAAKVVLDRCLGRVPADFERDLTDDVYNPDERFC